MTEQIAKKSLIGRRKALLLIAAAPAAAVAGYSLLNSASAQSAKAGPNPIVLENQYVGSDLWQYKAANLKRATDLTGQVKGYASATSINKGESLTFHLTVNPVQSYKIEIYRLGWYQGKGGRLMQQIGPLDGVRQPDPKFDPNTGLISCEWSPGYKLTIPDSWTSGIYIALLINEQKYANYIPFVVRDDARKAELLYQQSVTTYQAYNNYPMDKGGKSLYAGVGSSYGPNTLTGDNRAVKVSFDRPYAADGAGECLKWESYFVRWLERSGYDVAYSTNLDTHANGQKLLNYKGFLSVGHDEYWSKAMYDAAEAARDAGVNLGFFGANALYWQVRFESSASGAPNRVMVCYKDAKLDPVKDTTATVTWRDPALNRPEQGLLGVQYDGWTEQIYFPFIIKNSQHWIYEGTGFRNGDAVPGLVGYEADSYHPQLKTPDNLNNSFTLLSESPYTDHNKKDWLAHSCIYQAPSKAWVFAAGTIGWSWGLDNFDEHRIAHPGIQRMTANLLDKFSSFAPNVALGLK